MATKYKTQLDLLRLVGIDRRYRDNIILEMLSEVRATGGSPYLSDLYVEQGGMGGFVLQKYGESQHELARQMQPLDMFKIRVICDQWGNKPVPGDVVEHRVMNKACRTAGPDDISNAKRMGVYEQRYLDIRKFIVDEKGCIECPFEPAGHFLNTYGVHSISNMPITMKKNHSTEPADTGNGTEKLHVHYWRYAEMTPEQYAKLPNIDNKQAGGGNDRRGSK